MSRLPPLVLYSEIALASQAAVRPTVEIGPFSIWNATGGGRPSRPFDPEVNLGSILWRGLDWLPLGDPETSCLRAYTHWSIISAIKCVIRAPEWLCFSRNSTGCRSIWIS